MTTGRWILIVDDDEDIRTTIALILGEESLETQVAKDGIEALDLLETGTAPSLILLDLMMPRLDGEGFLHALRARPGWSPVPVVILSGHASGRHKAQELSVDAHLVKPIELDALLEVTHRFVAA